MDEELDIWARLEAVSQLGLASHQDGLRRIFEDNSIDVRVRRFAVWYFGCLDHKIAAPLPALGEREQEGRILAAIQDARVLL